MITSKMEGNMLSIISKSLQLNPILKTKTSESKGYAYSSYLNHKSFYRKKCFDLLKAAFLDSKEVDLKRIYKKKDDKPKPQNPPPTKAKCGHPLWHPDCLGCSPLNKTCWGKCQCFDWIDDYPPVY